MKKIYPALIVLAHLAGCLVFSNLYFNRCELALRGGFSDELPILMCGTLVFCVHYGLLYAVPKKTWKIIHLTILWAIEIILLYIPMVMMFGFVFFGVTHRVFTIEDGIIYLKYIVPGYLIFLLARIISTAILFWKQQGSRKAEDGSVC